MVAITKGLGPEKACAGKASSIYKGQTRPLVRGSSSTKLSQLLTTNSNDLLWPFITPRHRLRGKHSLSIFEKTCLLIRCLAVDVLLLGAYAPAGICFPSRCLATGLYVAISMSEI
jgi:hypothetical protein